MYSTNTQQMADVPVTFNASIPEWLTGTYVSANFLLVSCSC